MARKSKTNRKQSRTDVGQARSSGIGGSPGQTIKGQYEQDPKRRLGQFGNTGEPHRKT